MIKYRLLALAGTLAALTLLAGCGDSATTSSTTAPTHAAAAHWGYEGSDGPAHWGALSPEYRLCSTGKEQSPIDLAAMQTSSTAGLSISYAPANTKLENNGHTIQANGSSNNSIAIGHRRYILDQFHFHSPSEHSVSGKSAAFEIHLVHKNGDQVAVLGVLGKRGATNPAFERLWKSLPTKKGATQTVPAFDPMSLLPSGPGSDTVYRYQGSLTTPPCTEGLTWSVFKKPITLSSKQIHRFAKIFHDNARPIQPLNNRTVELGTANLGG